MDYHKNPGFLLHKIGAVMERVSDQVLFEEFGIGFSQFKILFALQHSADIQQKQIAQFLGQTEASVSRQIKLLKTAKFIEVRLGKDDRKKHHVSLTRKGEEVTVQAMSCLNGYYEPILSILTPQEQARLTPMLLKVHERMATACSQLFEG
jgi:DNA-binding MarR family transcriptional regulator